MTATTTVVSQSQMSTITTVVEHTRSDDYFEVDARLQIVSGGGVTVLDFGLLAPKDDLDRLHVDYVVARAELARFVRAVQEFEAQAQAALQQAHAAVLA